MSGSIIRWVTETPHCPKCAFPLPTAVPSIPLSSIELPRAGGTRLCLTNAFEDPHTSAAHSGFPFSSLSGLARPGHDTSPHIVRCDVHFDDMHGHDIHCHDIDCHDSDDNDSHASHSSDEVLYEVFLGPIQVDEQDTQSNVDFPWRMVCEDVALTVTVLSSPSHLERLGTEDLRLDSVLVSHSMLFKHRKDFALELEHDDHSRPIAFDPPLKRKDWARISHGILRSIPDIGQSGSDVTERTENTVTLYTTDDARGKCAQGRCDRTVKFASALNINQHQVSISKALCLRPKNPLATDSGWVTDICMQPLRIDEADEKLSSFKGKYRFFYLVGPDPRSVDIDLNEAEIDQNSSAQGEFLCKEMMYRRPPTLGKQGADLPGAAALEVISSFRSGLRSMKSCFKWRWHKKKVDDIELQSLDDQSSAHGEAGRKRVMKDGHQDRSRRSYGEAFIFPPLP